MTKYSRSLSGDLMVDSQQVGELTLCLDRSRVESCPLITSGQLFVVLNQIGWSDFVSRQLPVAWNLDLAARRYLS